MSLLGLDGLTGAWVRTYSHQHVTPRYYTEIGEKQESREQQVKSGRLNSGIRVPETHDHIKLPLSGSRFLFH